MIKSILNQYISECNKALIHTAKITKSFEKVFKDTMKLLMAIPNRINFLQLGRYGSFSEQTCRNNFEKTFDWLSFNIHLAKKHFTGDRKAIAIDPNYLLKAGHKTPWIGSFWSGQAGSIKRGLESWV